MLQLKKGYSVYGGVGVNVRFGKDSKALLLCLYCSSFYSCKADYTKVFHYVLIGNPPLTQKDNEFARMQLHFASSKDIPLNSGSEFLFSDVVKSCVNLND